MNHLSPNFDGWERSEFPFLGPLSSHMLLIGVNPANRYRVESSLVELGLVRTWEPGEPLVLPPVTSSGTLILHEVGALTEDDQLRLLAWLEQIDGRTRVVCTTAESLYARVEAGLFIEALYYRLNTVSITVGLASRPRGGDGAA